MAIGKTTASSASFEDIMRDISQKRFRPVYFLMGKENYYIDKIAEAVVKNALTEDERAFNLMSYYGMDASVGDVINSAKSFPMGAERCVVFLREAQQMKNLDELTYYLQNPQPSTILLITYKNGVLDRRKKLGTLIQNIGVLYESKEVREDQLPNLVLNYVSRHGFTMSPKSAGLIAESVGADLSRLFGELDKLMVSLPKDQKNITEQIVEGNIGISKDYNYWEFQEALVRKDVLKANKIANYFDKNQKACPLQMILPSLFRFFSTAMMAYYSPDKSERGLSQFLGMQDWQIRRNVLPILKNYSGRKVFEILDEIRKVDGKSKGMDGSKVPSGELLKQLIYFILH